MKFKTLTPALLMFMFICLLIIMVDIKGTQYLMARIPKIPYGDKVGHFFLFGILALLVNISLDFRRFSWRNYNWFLGSMLVFCFATLEEFSQMFLSTRSFDLLDLTADFVGIWFFGKIPFQNIKNKVIRLIRN